MLTEQDTKAIGERLAALEARAAEVIPGASFASVAIVSPMPTVDTSWSAAVHMRPVKTAHGETRAHDLSASAHCPLKAIDLAFEEVNRRADEARLEARAAS